MNKAQILVVEDDKAIRNLVTTTLETKDYKFHIAEDGAKAIIEVVSYKPDVIILDLGLPDIDGVEIIRKIRSWSNVPIIVVSARSDDSDKIEALDNGADDYLTKPFSVDELLARLRVALRRVNYNNEIKNNNESIFLNGDLKIDYASRNVFIGEKEIHLTPIEYNLICLLSNNLGKVLTHNFILKEIRGSILPTDTPALRVFMATLRKKIEEIPSKPKYIQTHVGIGYRMIKIDSKLNNN